MSSQGAFGGTFTSVTTGVFTDTCTRNPDPIFNVAGVGTRRVEPRNTPTVINAVFNFRNFWDGRANNVFNGVNPFGPRDQTQRIFKLQANGHIRGGQRRARSTRAWPRRRSGRRISAFEMSCDGRTFPKLGRKLLRCGRSSTQTGLNDSVLGPYATDARAQGQVRRADQGARSSRSGGTRRSPIGGFSQMENNFSLFWGLAIQALRGDADLRPDAVRPLGRVGQAQRELTGQERGDPDSTSS